MLHLQSCATFCLPVRLEGILATDALARCTLTSFYLAEKPTNYLKTEKDTQKKQKPVTTTPKQFLTT